MALQCISILVYGWLVHFQIHPAAPIPFLFLEGIGQGLTNNMINTLLLDYLPGKGAGATASLNLVRCLMGAAGVAASDRLLSVGAGWCFTVVMGINALSIPCGVVLWCKGPQWRAKRFAQVA